MNSFEPEKVLKSIPEFGEASLNVSRGIHKAVLDGGEQTRNLADLLHGTWLGHPLHPVFTDMVIGAWSLASFFDLFGDRSRRGNDAATRLVGLGNLIALPTALAGITDFSTMPRRAISTGAAHGLLNTLALGLNTLSYLSRKRGKRGRGVFYTSLALGMLLASGWLGGEMAYRYRIGVNKIEEPEGPEDWKAVLDDSELADQKPVRVEVDGAPVLLYRYGGEVYAIGAVCSHEGGPLDEGSFDGYCVECPWHQSVFDLRDGSVVHGPATYAEPAYAARIQNGKIELKRIA